MVFFGGGSFSRSPARIPILGRPSRGYGAPVLLILPTPSFFLYFFQRFYPEGSAVSVYCVDNLCVCMSTL